MPRQPVPSSSTLDAAATSFLCIQEALDAWALGVMAFELLTGQPALRMNHGKEKVRNVLVFGFYSADLLILPHFMLTTSIRAE